MEILEYNKLKKHPLIESFMRNPIYFSKIYDPLVGRMTLDQIYQCLAISYDAGWFNPGCIPPKIEFPMKTKYSEMFITYGRDIIYKRIVELIGENPSFIDVGTLGNICSCYFDVFVGHHPKYISYKLDNRKKGKIGECVTVRNGTDVSYCIVLAPKIVTACFKDNNTPLVINGITVKNRVEVMQITIEHEIAHYLVNNSDFDIVKLGCQPGDKKFGHHGVLFRQVVSAYFGHTATNGSLHSPEVVDSKNFVIGQKVSFQHAGKKLTGEIIKLNKKTCKILVNLDDETIAHCDVSYSNLILD